MATRICSVCVIVIFSFCQAVFGDNDVGIAAEPSGTSVTRRSADRIELALRETTECDFAARPLDEVCRYLEEHHHIQFWIDNQALNDEGINIDVNVTFKAKEIALESALKLILQPIALTFVNREGVLCITTQAKADEIMSTRVYPVADLVAGGAYFPLMNLFQQTVQGKWNDVDGEGGSMCPLPNAKSIAIKQTQSAHREISGLLVAVRKAMQLQQVDSIPANPDDPHVLNVGEPALSVRHHTRSSDVPSWQRPRIHKAE